MKKHKGIVVFLLFVMIVFFTFVLKEIYHMRKQQKTPDEIIQIEEEKTWIAYQENLAYALDKRKECDFVVVLNPAHGGMDTGAQNVYTTEKEIALAVCEQVIVANTDKKLGIFLTRDDDVAMDNEMRMAFLEELQPDLFIDIHVEEKAPLNAYGTTVYYDTGYYNRKLPNMKFADIMEKNIVTAVEGFACGIYETKTEEMNLLKTLTIPAVSVSCGNLLNEKEGALLSMDGYQRNLAKGILNGIQQVREILENK